MSELEDFCHLLRVLFSLFQGLYYEKYRPSYTDEHVNHVIKSLHTGDEPDTQYNILELGAGTGKFTRKLFDQLKTTLRYLAAEPSDEFFRTFQQLCPLTDMKHCDAAHIPLPDRSVQNIICAQCFHWFDNKESLDEMIRILVPGGRVLCVWIHRDRDVDWVKEMEDVLKEYFDISGTPLARARNWKVVMETYKGLELREHSFLPGVQNMKGPKDFVLDHYASISVIAILDTDAKGKAREKFRAVLNKYFDDSEVITIPFISECYFVEKVK